MREERVKTQLPLSARRTIRIDHRATFRAFCDAHGGDPIMHNGTLLFRDGWRHSATSYRGPEFAPPDDTAERVALIHAYWRRRREVLELRHRDLELAIANLDDAQRASTAPLYERVTYRGDAGMVTETRPIDVIALREQLDILASDLDEAKRIEAQTKPKERT